MLRKQAVTLKLTDINKQIFECYERARPQHEDGKLMTVSYSAAPASPEATSLGSTLATNVIDTAVKAEAGAIFGQKGVVAAIAYAGVKTVTDHVFRRANKNELIEVVDLNYLEPAELLDNTRIGSTPEQRKNRIEVLRRLYHQALTYQKLKGTRYGMKLFGIKLGEYRDDNLIDDHKYLVNILIGRKLRFAAEATSEAEYELQLRHLLQFLKAIIDKPTITNSKSNDTSYLSIRSLINIIKKELGELVDKEAIEANAQTQFDVLKHNVENTIDEATRLLKELINRATHLTCNIEPDLLRNYNPNNPLTNGLAINKRIAKPASYPNALFNGLYAEYKIHLNLDTFIAGLKEYTGMKDFSNEAQLKNIFNVIIENQQALDNLLKALKSFEEIKEAAGLNGFIALSDELAYLLQKIKTTQFTLIKNQKAFADALSIHSSASTSQEFKNAFVKYGYSPLVIDITPINEAIIALEQISMNKAEKQAELEAHINILISEFKAKAQLCGYSPSMESITEVSVKLEEPIVVEEPIEVEEATEDEDHELKDWVKVNLEQPLAQSVKFTNELPEEIKTMPWYKTLFTSELARRAEEQEKQIAEQSAQLAAKDAEVERLKQDKTAAENAKKTAETATEKALKENTNAAKALDNLLKRNDLHDAVEKYRTVFNGFINDYLRNNKNTSFWNFFHHNHGSHGQFVALKFKDTFNDMLDNLKMKETLTIENLNAAMEDRFLSLLTSQRDKLDGNFNPHSLKTYLLAYANCLTNDNINNTDTAMQVNTFHRDVFIGKDSSDIEFEYLRKLHQNDLPVGPISYMEFDKR